MNLDRSRIVDPLSLKLNRRLTEHWGNTLKIAEALMLRADMQKKIASLRDRIAKNAIVQQGDEPSEHPAKLIDESFGVMKELEHLVYRVNQANSITKLPDGRTLTAAIARRETLMGQHSLLQSAVAAAQGQAIRYSNSEIKWVTPLKVSSLQRQSEDIAKSLRELNAAIQETNWRVELPE